MPNSLDRFNDKASLKRINTWVAEELLTFVCGCERSVIEDERFEDPDETKLL
jgi:hypothetical protein